VSPVAAALLLIVIGVLAGVLLHFWLSGFQGQVAQGAENTGTLSTCLKIEGIEVAERTPDGVAYKIWLLNCGTSTLYLQYVYLLDSKGNAYHVYYSGYWPLPPGQPNYLWLWVPANQLRLGEKTTIKVVTTSGVEAIFTFTPT